MAAGEGYLDKLLDVAMEEGLTMHELLQGSPWGGKIVAAVSPRGMLCAQVMHSYERTVSIALLRGKSASSVSSR